MGGTMGDADALTLRPVLEVIRASCATTLLAGAGSDSLSGPGISVRSWSVFPFGRFSRSASARRCSPMLAFVAVLVAQRTNRKSAKELDARSRREEGLRTLRWAAELAVDASPRTSRLGVDTLTALLDSDIFDTEWQGLVETALDAVYGEVEEEVEEIGPGAVVEQCSDPGDDGSASTYEH